MKLGDTEKLMLEDTTTELQKRKKGKPTRQNLDKCSWKWNRTIGSYDYWNNF